MNLEYPRSFTEVRSSWPDPGGELRRLATEFKYDREQYIANLIDVKNVLDAHGVPFMLAFGTLLGAIRDAGPIEGDQDVDVLVDAIHEPKLVKLFVDHEMLSDGFKSFGFTPVRVSNHILTIERDGTDSYVDVYLFRKKEPAEGVPDDGMHWCAWQYSMDDWRIKNPWNMPLHGLRWDVPGQPEGYLSRKYGEWRVPRRNFHCQT